MYKRLIRLLKQERVGKGIEIQDLESLKKYPDLSSLDDLVIYCQQICNFYRLNESALQQSKNAKLRGCIMDIFKLLNYEYPNPITRETIRIGVIRVGERAMTLTLAEWYKIQYQPKKYVSSTNPSRKINEYDAAVRIAKDMTYCSYLLLMQMTQSL